MRLDDVRAIQYGDVLVEGERWPNSIHVIEHSEGRVLVDTGMIDSTPALDAEWGIRFDAEKIPRDVVCVVNTHLHFDHCGGNRLFAGTPVPVRGAEWEAAREPDYTIPEWVEFEGATYVEHDGEAEILPGVRLLPTPGHTDGHQIVVVETDEGTVVLGGDVGYSFAEIGRGDTPGRQLVLELGAPTYLAHVEDVRV